MRIERKKEIGRVKITHNRKLFWIIIFLLAVLIFLIIFIRRIPENGSMAAQLDSSSCKLDSDCFADSCCHAKGCINSENKPVCNSIMCTQECVPNTLDCGQGACKCLNNKCGVEWKE